MYEFKKMKLKNIDREFTASFGVVEYNGYEEFESFIKRSDNALYESKEKGRDNYVIGK